MLLAVLVALVLVASSSGAASAAPFAVASRARVPFVAAAAAPAQPRAAARTPAPLPTAALTPAPAPRPDAFAASSVLPTPMPAASGRPDYAITIDYILGHAATAIHASEVRAGQRPRARYRIDYTSTYTFRSGTHCDLGVANTFVESFTDTGDALRGLDPPQLYAIDDGSAHNVFSPAFSAATATRTHSEDRPGGATRNTYTWDYAFVYHFNGVDLSRLRLVTITDPEKRETFEPFMFTDHETGERVLRAVTHAANLCGARVTDPFAGGPTATPAPDPFASPH